MTETPRSPKTLTPERLEEIRELLDRQLHESFPEDRFYGNEEMADLFQHIDALTAALQAARAERDALRQALEGLVGGSTREELEQIELGLRLLPAPAEDKAAGINAVHALLAALTAPEGAGKR